MTFVDYRTWTTGELVGASHFNQDVRDNGKELWREIAYVESSSSVSTTSTTEGGGGVAVTSGVITYAARPTLIEFFAPQFQSYNSILTLYDSASVLGRLGGTVSGSSGSFDTPVMVARRLTPSAASHEYQVKLHAVSGTARVAGGAGGSATDLPMFIRVMQRNG